MPRAIQIPLPNSRHATRRRFYDEICGVGTRIEADEELLNRGYPHYERREEGWYSIYADGAVREYLVTVGNLHYYVSHPNLRPRYTLELATSSTLIDALEAYVAAP